VIAPAVTGDEGARPRPHSLGRLAGLFGIATLASRVLGLVRDQLFAALLGTSVYSDAFVVAFRIPNLLRDLFAEGALSAAFVPVFSDYLARRGRDEAYALAGRVLTTLLVVTSGLVALAMIFPSVVVGGIAPGFDADAKELTARLAQIMLPFLPMVSASAVLMGVLNAQDRFGAPALAPALFNVVSIGVGLVLFALGLPARTTVIGWSVGTLLGGLAQLAYQASLLRRVGFRLQPSLDLRARDEGMRRLVKLMGPAVIGLAATQTNIFLNTVFASADERAVSYLNYAFRVIYLPIGVFGVAAGSVAGARVARAAALNDLSSVRQSASEALRYLIVFTIPSSVGLIVLAPFIVRLIYQHGKFGPEATVAVATVLGHYALALLSYSSVKVLAASCYALGRARVAVVASVLAVATNVGFNLAFMGRLGYPALALGTAFGATANALILFSFLHLAVRFPLASLLVLIGKVGLAALAMALVVRPMAVWLEACSVGSAALTAALAALVPIAAGVVVYATASRLLGVAEVDALFRKLKRRRS
jgi:putative peptidoglycan lipid II flippase